MQIVGYINTNKDYLHGQKMKFTNFGACITSCNEYSLLVYSTKRWDTLTPEDEHKTGT